MKKQNQLTTTDGPAGSLAPDPRSAPRPTYFVMPNLPRDVWYGFADKPESAQLVAFVEMRHAYICKNFDAQMVADAMNGADAEKNRLRKENQRLRAALKEERRALEDDGEFVDAHELS